MNLFARITKVDEAKREVWGRLAHEVVDNADEIFDYDSSKPYFQQWSAEFEKMSNGRSLGNVRAMHGTVAAGKLVGINFNDAEKAIDIGSKIVDNNEWDKVLEGVYNGYSIGGKYIPGSKKVEKIEGRDVTRYTAKPNEASIVDKPCIPTAVFFDVIKADGVVEQRKFKTPEKAVDELADLLDKGSVTAQTLVALAKAAAADAAELDLKPEEDEDEDEDEAKPPAGDKKPASGDTKPPADDKKPATDDTKPGADDKKVAADAGNELAIKGMYNVQSFASALENLSYIARSAQSDFDTEGDGSPVPSQLRSWITNGVGIFKAMAAEEADELVATLTAQAVKSLTAYATESAVMRSINDNDFDIAAVPALVEGHLSKDERSELGEKPTNARMLTALVRKFGKGGKEDITAHLQGAHDSLVKCGLVKCGSMKADNAGMGKADGPGSQLLTELQKTIGTLAAKVKKLEEQPMPAKGRLRAVEKGSELSDGDDTDDVVIKSPPGVHDPEQAQELIKLAITGRTLVK